MIYKVYCFQWLIARDRGGLMEINHLIDFLVLNLFRFQVLDEVFSGVGSRTQGDKLINYSHDCAKYPSLYDANFIEIKVGEI